MVPHIHLPPILTHHLTQLFFYQDHFALLRAPFPPTILLSTTLFIAVSIATFKDSYFSLPPSLFFLNFFCIDFMEKGWAFSTFDTSDFFMKKPNLGFNLSPKSNHAKSTMFSSTEFPVSRTNTEEQATTSSPLYENRVVMAEVDFFSTKSPNDHIDSKTSSHNIAVKEENSHGDATLPLNDSYMQLHLHTTNNGRDQTMVDPGISCKTGDTHVKNELKLLQVELKQLNAENQRLRGMLTQVSNNYSALQMRAVTVLMQHQQQSTSTLTENTQQYEIVERKAEERKHEIRELVQPRQFMELGPRAMATVQERDEASDNTSSEERTQSGTPLNTVLYHDQDNTILGRDRKRTSREESPQSESWAPDKFPKLVASKTVVDQPTDATMRKARVSVRARSEAPMISDGCQWRKYGQKMAKGNPCPRAYYRCTMAAACPVRKQVQRCAEDRTILITTYEGNHNHPLPPAAMAMASTTSAAANMLLSGSMSSADLGLMNPSINLARAILPHSSGMATISASAPFPTITLDLTHSPTPLQSQTLPFNNFQLGFGSQGPYNRSMFSGLQHSQNMEAHQSFAHSSSLGAATAAITADPNFTAALAAAITSIMGGAYANNSNSNNNYQQQ
ncbi:hypothetical protein LguiB_005182 [Lonicera macranthoides]